MDLQEFLYAHYGCFPTLHVLSDLICSVSARPANRLIFIRCAAENMFDVTGAKPSGPIVV
jgi:hypothetical protein